MLETALEVVGIERANLWAITPDQARFVNLAGAGFTEEEWRDFEGIEIPLQEAGVIYRSYVEGTQSSSTRSIRCRANFGSSRRTLTSKR